VSTALSELAREGELRRREDGTWLLTGVPVGMPEPAIERVVPMRRRLLPADAVMTSPREDAVVVDLVPAPPAPIEPVHVAGVELRAVLDRVRGEALTQVEQMRAALIATSELAQHAYELRERCRETRRSYQRQAHTNRA
jgi:hypothetical protein